MIYSLGLTFIVILLVFCYLISERIPITWISTIVKNPNQIKLYFTSIIFFALLFGISNTRFYDEYLESFLPDETIRETDYNRIIKVLLIKMFPIKSFTYIFYLSILIFNQLELLGMKWNFEPEVLRFLQINEYTIVLLIALERIQNAIMKELKQKKKYWDIYDNLNEKPCTPQIIEIIDAFKSSEKNKPIE